MLSEDHKFVDIRASESVIPLRISPDPLSEMVSSLLFGEDASIIEAQSAFLKIRCNHDGYEGWVPFAETEIASTITSHRVSLRQSPVFLSPDIKAPALRILPFGSRLTVRSFENNWAILDDGTALRASHVCSIDDTSTPAIELAEQHFIGAPYVWGGRSTYGIDCSGLVQVTHGMAGIALPRDSRPQCNALTPIQSPDRGDLACFKGHIGIMADKHRLLHANARAMAVTIDDIEFVKTYIEEAEGPGQFLGYFRLP